MNHKARNSKKILKAVEAREELIINLVFDEFMKCLKPKPRFLPAKFFVAFWMSLIGSKYTWRWFTRRYVYDLSGAEHLKPKRFDAVRADIEKEVEQEGFWLDGGQCNKCLKQTCFCPERQKDGTWVVNGTDAPVKLEPTKTP